MLFPSAAERRDAAADLAVCRALLRHGSRSFHAASLLLPRRVRDPATALYAFCRLADDAVDGKDGTGAGDRDRDGRPSGPGLCRPDHLPVHR